MIILNRLTLVLFRTEVKPVDKTALLLTSAYSTAYIKRQSELSNNILKNISFEEYFIKKLQREEKITK